MAFPAWVQALEKAPRGSAIAGSIGFTVVLSGFVWSIMMARGQKVSTLSDGWKAANKDYMRYQNMVITNITINSLNILY